MVDKSRLRRLPELVPGDKVYCRKPVRISGRTYPAGQEFPYRKVAIDWRRVVQMYSQQIIVKRSYFTDEEWEQIQLSNPATAKGEEIKIHPKGGGWYEILVSGKKIGTRSYRKEAAEKKVKSLRKAAAKR